MQLALGNFLTLRIPPGKSVNKGAVNADDGWTELRFQNFWIGQNALWRDVNFPGSVEQSHAFLPFGFSGAVLNRQGDNIEASLVFPNNAISRGFLDQAVRERWTAVIRVVEVTTLEDANAYPTKLYQYKGIVSGGGWRAESLELALSSVLDAVGLNLPARSIHQRLVGNVPFSSNIALQ